MSVGGASVAATAQPDPSSQTLSATEEQELISQLESGFETVFTEIIQESSPGVWEVNPAAAAENGISTEEAESLAALMESSPSDLENDPRNEISTRDAGSYARCVVSDAIGLPLSPDDARAIGNLLKQKRWRDAAEKTIAVASLNGSAALLKYGFGAIGGPVGLAAKFAISAGACALGEKMP